MSFYSPDQRFALIRVIAPAVVRLNLREQPLSQEEQRRGDRPKAGSLAWCTAVHTQRIVEAIEHVEEKRSKEAQR